MKDFRKVPGEGLGYLIWKVVRMNRLEILESDYPDDFQQECYLFLLEWEGVGGCMSFPLPKDEFRRFSRMAARHFYRMAVAYGLNRRKKSVGFDRREETAGLMGNY